jgi:hypothetical protein
MPKGRKY